MRGTGKLCLEVMLGASRMHSPQPVGLILAGGGRVEDGQSTPDPVPGTSAYTLDCSRFYSSYAGRPHYPFHMQGSC